MGKIFRSREQWDEIFKRYESSDLSVSAFCKREGIAKQTFSKQLSKRQSFVELPKVRQEESFRLEIDLPDLSIRIR